jgi:hypothetical protein
MPNKIITMKMKQQEKPNWCYSSVIQAIIRYYNKIPNNTRLNQRNIASIVAHNGCINGMQDPYAFLDGRGYIAGIFRKSLTWNVITQQIDAGHPIILLVGKHYIILNGYSGSSSHDRYRELYFLDPLKPEGKIVTVKGTDFNHYGFPTDYKHTGLDSYEIQHGYILTQSPLLQPSSL